MVVYGALLRRVGIPGGTRDIEEGKDNREFAADDNKRIFITFAAAAATWAAMRAMRVAGGAGALALGAGGYGLAVADAVVDGYYTPLGVWWASMLGARSFALPVSPAALAGASALASEVAATT